MGIIKRFVIATISLYLVSICVTGLTFANGISTLALTGAVLSLTSLLIKPLLNILLLPLNLLTFGLFRWVTYAVTLYLVTLIVPGFSVGTFAFAGFNSYWLSIPPLALGGLLGLLAFSLSISFVSSTIHWIMK